MRPAASRAAVGFAVVLAPTVVGCSVEMASRPPRGGQSREALAASRGAGPAPAASSGAPRPVFGPASTPPSSQLPGGITASELGSFSPSEARLLSCTDNANGIPSRAVVFCPAGCRRRHGVWGSRIYTSDSSVCVAAIHDGVLGERGGYALLLKRSGRISYPGEEAHGVVSSPYGAYPESFEIFGVSGVETFPFRLACHHDANTVLTKFPPRAVLSCPRSCPRGKVYGDGFYTVDSSVCGAAQHAGVPPERLVVRAAGQRSDFVGRWRNGIRSSAWTSVWEAFTVHPWIPSSR